jgi:hypothetical protein
MSTNKIINPVKQTDKIFIPFLKSLGILLLSFSCFIADSQSLPGLQDVINTNPNVSNPVVNVGSGTLTVAANGTQNYVVYPFALIDTFGNYVNPLFDISDVMNDGPELLLNGLFQYGNSDTLSSNILDIYNGNLQVINTAPIGGELQSFYCLSAGPMDFTTGVTDGNYIYPSLVTSNSTFNFWDNSHNDGVSYPGISYSLNSNTFSVGYTVPINNSMQNFNSIYSDLNSFQTSVTDGNYIYPILSADSYGFNFYDDSHNDGIDHSAISYTNNSDFSIYFPQYQSGTSSYTDVDIFSVSNNSGFYYNTPYTDASGNVESYTNFAVNPYNMNFNSQLQNQDGSFTSFTPFWVTQSGNAGFTASNYNSTTGTYSTGEGFTQAGNGDAWFFAFGNQNPDGTTNNFNTADITPDYSYFQLEHQQTSGYYTNYDGFEVANWGIYMQQAKANTNGSDTYFYPYISDPYGNTSFQTINSPNNDGNYENITPVQWSNTGNTQFSSWNGLNSQSGDAMLPRFIVGSNKVTSNNVMPNSTLYVGDSTYYGDNDTLAELDVKSTSKGILLPRLNTAQMNAIPTGSPENGMLLYNTDSLGFSFYNGAKWCSLNGIGGKPSLQSVTSNGNTTTDSINILYNNHENHDTAASLYADQLGFGALALKSTGYDGTKNSMILSTENNFIQATDGNGHFLSLLFYSSSHSEDNLILPDTSGYLANSINGIQASNNGSIHIPILDSNISTKHYVDSSVAAIHTGSGLSSISLQQATDAGHSTTDSMFIGGTVTVGTTTMPTGYQLAVNGTALFTKAVVKSNSNWPNWPDYVFDDNYNLLPIDKLEKYLKEHKHLPEVPSAGDIEKDGIDLGGNQATLLKKIEELTMYIIDQNKKIEDQDQQIRQLKELQKRMDDLEAKLSKN